MTKSTRPDMARSPGALSDRLDSRLLAYTLAAGAGLAAAPELADAAIVHSGPINTTITTIGDSIDIDLDGNATDDLRVFLTGKVFYYGDSYVQLRVGGYGQPTGVIGASGYAAALSGGDTIGPLQSFEDIQFSSLLMAGAYYEQNEEGGYAGTYGPFDETGFLGVTFQIGGAAHYAWLQFDVTRFASESTGDVGIEATLLDFAYESCPREAILAGQTEGGASCNGPTVPLPPSLGLLALGAAGLGLWRLGKN